MKLIDKKGKLFGIVNIVDLIVVLLVVAVLAILGTKLMGNKVQSAVSEKVDCYTQVRIIGAHDNLWDEVVRQDMIGERLVSGNSYLNATVEDVWLEDYAIQATCADGTIITSLVPDKHDIIFLLKSQVAPESASPAIGSQELRSGKTYIVKTQTFECSGTIRYVEIGGYNPTDEFKKPQ